MAGVVYDLEESLTKHSLCQIYWLHPSHYPMQSRSKGREQRQPEDVLSKTNSPRHCQGADIARVSCKRRSQAGLRTRTPTMMF